MTTPYKMFRFSDLLAAAEEHARHISEDIVATYQSRKDDANPKSGGIAVVKRITDDRKSEPYYMVCTGVVDDGKIGWHGCDYAARDEADGISVAQAIVAAWDRGVDPDVEDDRCDLSPDYNPCKYWGHL